jgi:4-amino-4-deoxy-L-arabinose transferase-like glycosyltransferase
MTWDASLLTKRHVAIVVGAIALVLFAIHNLPWQLDNYDQAKQAFTSFEMIKEGHWLYQRTPHERVATKPPLVGWMSAGLFAATRSWELAWRLPSFLAALALTLFLSRAASKAYGGIAALIALSAFAFNLLTPRLASLVRTDTPLALVVFLIGLQIWSHIREQRKWSVRDRVVAFVLLSAGMLIKGPIIYAFLLPGIALFQWWRRKTNAPSAWCGWWPWLASLAIFLAWVIGGSIFVPNFFDQVVMREFVARFGETVHRPQPLYFYLPHLLHKFFPWSILMIALVVLGLRATQSSIRESWRKISPDTLWLICWAFGGLIVMSLIPSKRVDRIFPVVPPLCLLLAAQIGQLSVREQLRERIYRWSAVALVVALLFTGGYTVAKIFSGYHGHRDALVRFADAVRQEAAAHHWRYDVVESSDEGLLLYLQSPHYLTPDQVATEWNRGNLDAVVAPLEKAAPLIRDLQNATLSSLRSTERKGDQDFGYVLITR